MTLTFTEIFIYITALIILFISAGIVFNETLNIEKKWLKCYHLCGKLILHHVGGKDI